MCYCIKGFQKCVMKKCAPLIKGCLPKVPADGTCCPTSYDCSRSLKIRRQVRQSDNIQEDDENDSIDFFSLLFGSDEPQEEIKTETTERISEVTTVQPFKNLPTTEQNSFFDFIRAGLDIIDKNADKFSSVLYSNFSTTTSTTPDDTIINNPQIESKVDTKTTKVITTTPTTTTKPKVSNHSTTTGKTPSTTTKSTTKISSTRTTKKTKPSAAPSTTTITTKKTPTIIGSSEYYSQF
jgi:hypothetical protein